jgi:hypothetical protein
VCDVETAFLECDLASPVVAGVDVVFMLRFYAASLPFHIRSFPMTFEVSTASDEPDHRRGDNKVDMTIPIRILSKVTLHRYVQNHVILVCLYKNVSNSSLFPYPIITQNGTD